MNVIISSLTVLLLLTSCNNINPLAAKKSATSSTLPNKLTALLQDSTKTNPSSNISQLVQNVTHKNNDPQALFELANAHIQSAYSNQNMHEHDLAITYYNEILQLMPGNQAVTQALYNIYYDDTLNNRNTFAFAKATEYFKQLPEHARAKLNPPSLAQFVATKLLQEAQHQTMNNQALREILLRAIQEQPQNDNAYIQLAKFYSDDRYFSLALATLKLGAENITDSVELYNAIAATYENRSNINKCNYEHPNDIINAAKYYKLAILLSPNSSPQHYKLSGALFDQNLGYLGLYESELALALNQTSTNLSISAQNHSMLGYSQKANEFLERALNKGLTISDVSYHEIAMNQGNWQQAAKGFAAYIKTREHYSLYDLLKNDIIWQQLSLQQLPNKQQAQQQPWFANKKIDLTSTWEENLFNYWTRKINAEDLKKMAINRCEKTEYYFYTGYQDYRNGQLAQAKIKFSEALKQNTYRFIERPWARYFLEQ
jgi:hypothetical protein